MWANRTSQVPPHGPLVEEASWDVHTLWTHHSFCQTPCLPYRRDSRQASQHSADESKWVRTLSRTQLDGENIPTEPGCFLCSMPCSHIQHWVLNGITSGHVITEQGYTSVLSPWLWDLVSTTSTSKSSPSHVILPQADAEKVATRTFFPLQIIGFKNPGTYKIWEENAFYHFLWHKAV